MIEALVAAFELANVDVMVVKMPEATVQEVSTALLTKWNCQKSEIIGKPLMKFGTAMLSARHLPPDSRQPDQSIIEVNYAPPLGSHMKSVFRTQLFREPDGSAEMLLIGHIIASLEHHVLKEMRKAAFSYLFSCRTHMIGNIYMHYRVGMIFVHDHR